MNETRPFVKIWHTVQDANNDDLVTGEIVHEFSKTLIKTELLTVFSNTDLIATKWRFQESLNT